MDPEKQASTMSTTGYFSMVTSSDCGYFSNGDFTIVKASTPFKASALYECFKVKFDLIKST